jgi:hypothetical protein
MTKFVLAGAAIVGLVGPDLLNARPLSQNEKQVHQCVQDSMRGEALIYEPHQKRVFVAHELQDDVMVRMVGGLVRPGTRLVIQPLERGAHATAFARRVRGALSSCGNGSG